MKKFGLIGHPIRHSLSPALFKAAFGGRYTYDLIEEEDFEKAYEKFLDEYDTINVTAPFKEKAYRKADTCSPECEVIGAANILHKMEDGRIMAANSDQIGVTGAVMTGQDAQRRTNTTALIVGCGGAAKAAAYAMCCSGYKTIILNRNYEKAKDFALTLGENPNFDASAMPLDEFRRCFRKAGVIIYTLPVIIPAIQELSRIDLKGKLCGSEPKILVEANYKDPAFTPEIIARWKRDNRKFTYVSGKEWLLHQAIGAYRHFVSDTPDIEAMRAVIL